MTNILFRLGKRKLNAVVFRPIGIHCVSRNNLYQFVIRKSCNRPLDVFNKHGGKSLNRFWGSRA